MNDSPTHSAHTPGVSVIIPAFNYARFLPEAIDSVLGQTYPRVTCIVVDDGSTDDTPAVAAGYGDRIRYIRQENSGLSASRNTGIRAADTPFVAFLDADDALLPGFVESLMAGLRGKSREFVLAACCCEYMDRDGNTLPSRVRPIPTAREVRLSDVLYKTRFPADSVVVRRDFILECGGFDTSLRSVEDRDMWIRLCRHGGRLLLLPDVLIRIRKHPGSMSTDSRRMKHNGLRVLDKARASGKPPPWRRDYWNRFYSYYAFECAWMFMDEGGAAPAAKELLRSLLLWPLPMRHGELGQPVLFRLRALRTFLVGCVRSRDRQSGPEGSEKP